MLAVMMASRTLSQVSAIDYTSVDMKHKGYRPDIDVMTVARLDNLRQTLSSQVEGKSAQLQQTGDEHAANSV